jgi:YVTN family beta-propeller protein
VAGDEIWFNSGDGRVYFGSDPVSVVDAETFQVITNIPVGPTHSIAANSENNHIFVPVTGVGIKVFAESSDEEGEKGK